MLQIIFDPNSLQYIDTLRYEDNTKDVIFVCDNFSYSARCFNEIIQFIKGQRPDDELYDGTFATEEQAQLHDLRKELYNGDHQPLQIWIDSLSK